MKVIATIPLEECQVTLFWWNQKYILKFEKNQLEQTYKISEMETSEQEIRELINNEELIRNVMSRFSAMEEDLHKWLYNF